MNKPILIRTFVQIFFILHLSIISNAQRVNSDFEYKTSNFKSYAKHLKGGEIVEIGGSNVNFEISFKNGEIVIVDENLEVVEFYKIILEETQEIKDATKKFKTIFKGISNNRMATIIYTRNSDGSSKEMSFIFPALLNSMVVIFQLK